MATDVPSRLLRNETRSVLRRVGQRPQWLGRAEFVRRLSGRQADPGLRADLDRLAGDSTDELPPL